MCTQVRRRAAAIGHRSLGIQDLYPHPLLTVPFGADNCLLLGEPHPASVLATWLPITRTLSFKRSLRYQGTLLLTFPGVAPKVRFLLKDAPSYQSSFSASVLSTVYPGAHTHHLTIPFLFLSPEANPWVKTEDWGPRS